MKYKIGDIVRLTLIAESATTMVLQWSQRLSKRLQLMHCVKWGHIRAKLGTSVVALATGAENGVSYIVMATPDAVQRGVHAGKIAQEIGAQLGGKGGGRPDSAQGGGKSTADLPTAMERVRNMVIEQVK